MTGNAPVSRMRTAAWRGCAGCNGTLLLDEMQQGEAASLDAAGAYLLCRACRKRADAEEAVRPAVPGARCVHWSYQGGPFANLLIREVHGDLITVGVLGMGGTYDSEKRDVILGRWWPAPMRGRMTFRRAELRMKGL